MISTKNPWISANLTAEGEAHHLSFIVALWMEFKGNNIDSSAVALLYGFETDAIINPEDVPHMELFYIQIF